MLEKLKNEDYQQVYDILKHSFPTIERRTREGQKALLNNPDYEIQTYRAGQDVKAFIAFWKLDGFLFVEHFAVNEKYRNEGLGKKMLRELQQEFAMPICLEVELPETEMASRRIGFYEREGFHVNHYDYRQPPLREENPFLDLLLMTYPGPIDEETFLHYKDEMYRKVYKKV